MPAGRHSRIGWVELDIEDQTLPVLGQRMTQIAEQCALLLALAVEPRLSGSVVETCVSRLRISPLKSP